MIWNPWAEMRRLREERDRAYEAFKQEQYQAVLARETANRIAAHASVLEKINRFLCDRNGLAPEMVQVDDCGAVRLGLPPEAETRGTA